MPTLSIREDYEDDSWKSNIVICVSICGIASIVFLLLRYLSQRLVSSRGPTWSDWLLLIGWVFFAGFDVSFALTIHYADDPHRSYHTTEHILQILDMVSQSAYSFSMMFIKCSILSFYGSIFSSKRFRYCLWFVSAVVIIWALSFGSISLLQSMPKTARLDETVPKGTSIDYGTAFVVGAPINIITDFIILSMPIPLVWRLHVTKKKKLLLCFTFAMGGSACLISIIRLAVSLQDHGAIAGEWYQAPSCILSVIELTMGILAASIPTYRPLYRRLTSKHGLAKTVDQDVEPNDYKNNRLVDKNHQFGNDDHPTAAARWEFLMGKI
ncbi:uncharacterized protein GGS25DRAFT_520874 [Hypoxylon fragiforme]|uniref:uncharacterized protein n=1 Tax=Hypoxylon fragiforme TaxID=63214 RepID=UPI0020C5EF51|nr:uncharacterized protein GGS25DRAFT_520874 [Hypoxylon fragiforme]KAI2610068.1 hypothetical protein GGS25DRAFT_520874 [Hypoxylon fragiforme]